MLSLIIENSDTPDQDEQISQSYRRLETNLKFLGLTAIEDRLQDGVEETISSLRKAGIQIWVLTGDKKDTAINIAKSCQLFDSQTEICACNTEEDLINLLSFPGKYNVAFSSPIVKLLEAGNPTAIAAIQKASAVLCYRMTPSEKETVKLLLVHGHWFYYRLANVLLYFLYKNAMFVFVLYWAQFYSGFSANGIMDPLYMMLYPIIFTSVQPLAYGILDQDIEAEILLKDPSLYGKGIRGTIYKTSNFFLHMVDAIWQAAVVYFIALGAYVDSTVEAWEFGFVLASSLFFCNDLHLAFITRCWTKPMLFIHAFFITVHYVFFIFYTSITLPIFGTKSTPVGVALRCIYDPIYWFTLFISIVVALLPRFLIKVCQNAVNPGLVFKASLAERNVQPDCLPSCISGCSFL
uniref:P-type ATPase C-terminal domain-containing protein n=1 Tax=Panagrolaimus sp. PS1159 TaxID=55785 RepID=A0AC35FPV8_9BILA